MYQNGMKKYLIKTINAKIPRTTSDKKLYIAKALYRVVSQPMSPPARVSPNRSVQYLQFLHPITLQYTLGENNFLEHQLFSPNVYWSVAKGNEQDCSCFFRLLF